MMPFDELVEQWHAMDTIVREFRSSVIMGAFVIETEMMYEL